MHGRSFLQVSTFHAGELKRSIVVTIDIPVLYLMLWAHPYFDCANR